jgi:hypothetical protein
MPTSADPAALTAAKLTKRNVLVLKLDRPPKRARD